MFRSSITLNGRCSGPMGKGYHLCTPLVGFLEVFANGSQSEIRCWTVWISAPMQQGLSCVSVRGETSMDKSLVPLSHHIVTGQPWVGMGYYLPALLVWASWQYLVAPLCENRKVGLDGPLV